jgi:hypothetical protein
MSLRIYVFAFSNPRFTQMTPRRPRVYSGTYPKGFCLWCRFDVVNGVDLSDNDVFVVTEPIWRQCLDAMPTVDPAQLFGADIQLVGVPSVIKVLFSVGLKSGAVSRVDIETAVDGLVQSTASILVLEYRPNQTSSDLEHVFFLLAVMERWRRHGFDSNRLNMTLCWRAPNTPWIQSVLHHFGIDPVFKDDAFRIPYTNLSELVTGSRTRFVNLSASHLIAQRAPEPMETELSENDYNKVHLPPFNLISGRIGAIDASNDFESRQNHTRPIVSRKQGRQRTVQADMP